MKNKIFIFIITILASGHIFSQTNYIIFRDLVKFYHESPQNIYKLSEKENKATAVSDSLPLVNNQRIKVVSAELYPIKAAVDQEYLMEESIARTATEIKSQYSYNISFIKFYKKDLERSGLHEWNVLYKVQVCLNPSVSPFDSISQLELLGLTNKLEKQLNEDVNGLADQDVRERIFKAEINALNLFKKELLFLKDGGVTFDLFTYGGFEKFEFENIEGLGRTNQIVITNYNKFSCTDYEGYFMGNPSTGAFGEYLYANNGIALNETDFNFVIFITGKETTENQALMNSIAQQFNTSTAKIVMWLHFDFTIEPTTVLINKENTERDNPINNAYVKIKSNITKGEAESYIDNKFAGKHAEFSANEGVNTSMGTEDCKLNWQWFKSCAYHGYKDKVKEYLQINDNYFSKNVALAAGIFDGMLGFIRFFVEDLPMFVPVASSLADFAVKALFYGLGAATVGKLIDLYKNGTLKTLYHSVKLVWDGFISSPEDSLKTIVNYITSLYHGVKNQLAADFDGSVSDGLAYYSGIVLFDVLLSFLSGGASAAIKGSKIIKRISQLSDDLISIFQKETVNLVNHTKTKLCRILIGKCFVKDTPVLMASNPFRTTTAAYALAAMPVAVPIQDVQLLDYAVAHKSVNSTYGLTASTNEPDSYQGLLGLMDKDPYTSDQQRERDEYEPNEKNWYEVAFSQVGGSSFCKLALHNDWITGHGYTVDAIVNLNLSEQGISGPFKITSIKHIIPQKKPVDEDLNDEWEYRPVTGLFTHHSDAVHNITFSNNETIGVTAPHPIFSTTHNDWRLAGELEVGEKVLTYHGEATVLGNEKKSGSEKVYNLEIKDLHNFLVGNLGVVVHNGCAELIAEPLGIDLSKLIKAKRANNTSYNRILMKAGGEIDHKDAGFLDEIAGELDDDIVIPPKKNNPGFDGFSYSTGKTIEVKVLESETVLGQQKGIVNNAKVAYEQIKASGKTPNTDIRIKADKLTMAEAQAAWAGGTNAGTYNKPLDEWVDKIIVHCKDGKITLKG